MKTQTTANNVTITGNESGYYDITTAKGKDVQVTFWYGQVHVKLINRMAKTYGNVGLGKAFPSLGDAVESYKNADIKHALRVLLSELV